MTEIPPEALERVRPLVEALEAAFQPLKAKIPFMVEPAITLSEAAVLGE